MVDFSNLKKAALTVQQLPYVFEELEGAPKLFSLPAIEANKAYFNDMLRRVTARQGRRQRRGATVDTVKASRDEDRELLAKHCAKSWEGVIDSSGAQVEFNEANCLEFFKALPDDIFDGYRAWSTNSSNWVEVTDEDGSQLGEP
jgi:hypothetical protein